MKYLSLLICSLFFMHFNTNAQCSANFTHYDSLCNVSFHASGAATYSWNFGDGTTGMGQFTNHTYSSSGSYMVRLYAYNSMQNICDSTLHNVIVNCGGGCNANFTYYDSLCNVSFHASGAATYSWNFGDGTTGIGQFTNHTYSSSGSYMVRLYAYDFWQNICDSTLHNVIVNCGGGCNANFTFYDSLCNVSFHASGAATYSWNFGDGTTGMGQFTNHTYSSSGSYMVRLYAYNSMQNICDSTLHNVIVNCGGGCNANFTHYDSLCNVSFHASGAAGYSWDFGDGTTGIGQFTNHTYSSSGSYMVRLYAYNSMQNICDSTLHNVIVNCGGGCNANFTFYDSLCNVSFHASGAATYSWNFGDGTTGIGQFTNHTYSSSGSYMVRLYAYNSMQNICDSTLHNVIVNCGGGCNANFTFYDSLCNVNFHASGAATYSWNFGDGTTGMGQFTNHTYSSSGSYMVRLYAYDFWQNICDSTLHNVIVNCSSGCNANFTFYDSLCNVSFHASGAATYSWNFGDGTTGIGQFTNHTYSSSGSYMVRLYAYDFWQNICDSTLHNVIVNCSSGCNANFTHYDSLCNVSFHASGAATYSWNFGDGTTGMGQFTNHTYSSSGSYMVRLYAYNSMQNICDSTLHNVIVNCSGGCNANFTHYDSLCNVSFHASGAATYSWNFGDGTTGMGQFTNHTYSSSGSYMVRLYAYNSMQNICDSTLHNVIVNCSGGCNANFTHYDSLCNVSFHASGAATYSWNFGDGTTGMGQFTNHTYSSSGSYMVRLYAYNSMQNICDSTLHNVIVNCSGVGIENQDSGFNFTVYPNPAKDKAIIEITLSSNMIVEIRITNLIGELVGFVNYGSLLKGVHKLPLNSNLSSGIYILNMITPHGISSTKLIIEN